MSDYISREVAIEQIKKEWAKLPLSKTTGFAILMRVLRKIPAADVVERKQGKWLDVTTLDNEFICWVCSECRHGADFVYEPYNYCPNCGSYMRGDSDV